MKNKRQTGKPKELYDKESDVKWIIFKEGKEDSYYEIAPGYNLEFDKSGDIIGIEILDYSKRLLSDYGFESKNSNFLPDELRVEFELEETESKPLSLSNIVNQYCYL